MPGYHSNARSSPVRAEGTGQEMEALRGTIMVHYTEPPFLNSDIDICTLSWGMVWIFQGQQLHISACSSSSSLHAASMQLQDAHGHTPVQRVQQQIMHAVCGCTASSIHRACYAHIMVALCRLNLGAGLHTVL